jgi:hypothetical protein
MMRGGCRVLWLHGSRVYHHAYGLKESKWQRGVITGTAMMTRCGVMTHTPLHRPQEGSEMRAQRLSLRACKRCWPEGRPDLTGS